MILKHGTIDFFWGVFLHKNRGKETRDGERGGGRGKKEIIREREMEVGEKAGESYPTSHPRSASIERE